MASDKRSGKKVPEYVRREDSPGLRLDSGPYIGKIVNNIDYTMSGRLQIWIPDLGAGDETNPSNWRTVSYASPFFGSTTQDVIVPGDKASQENSFTKVRHTYGMWFTVPDIGNLVLCTFVAGDPMRGYWFACVPNQLGHHMVPGLAGDKNIDDTKIKDPIVQKLYAKKIMPVVEFNENVENLDWSKYVSLKKPLHEEQAKILFTQGLDEDTIRGTISSSSQRETPSTVFGISTPGRPFNENATDTVTTRKGGHQFVMDDGDTKDKDRLIRLRTAGGHQLLMNDSEKILYIGNINGSVWLEMTGSGHLNVFSASSVNIRTKADLNLHADKDINLNAGGTFNLSATKSINLQSKEINLTSINKTVLYAGSIGLASSGRLDLNAAEGGSFSSASDLKFTGSAINLNSGQGPKVTQPAPITVNKLSETGLKDGKWISTPGALNSIVKIAPTHEPWDRKTGTPNAALTGPLVQSTPAGSENADVTKGDPPTEDVKQIECVGGGSTDIGPTAAANASVSKGAPSSYMNNTSNPTPASAVGPLTIEQTKALMTQIGYSESTNNYKANNQFNYIGKYQFGAAVLSDQGYIKKDALALYGNNAVNYPSSWRGKDGINSKEDFLSNPGVQETAMLALLNVNYSTLVKTQGIKNEDDQCTVGGMLTVSHLLGTGGANTWRKTGVGQDANNTSGTTYFNRGRYAVDVLAKLA